MSSRTLLAQKPLHFFEKMYSSIIPCFVNLAIDIADPKIIPVYLERIKNASMPFFMRCDSDTLYRFREAEMPVHHLPSNITSLEECINWAIVNCPATGTNPLATVAVNSNKIVLSYCHSFFSGAMLLNVLKEIQNPTNEVMPLLPLTLEETHPHINQMEPISCHYQKPTCTHYRNRRVTKPDPADILQLVNTNYDVTKLKSVYRNGKVTGLTEFLAGCYILVGKSFQRERGEESIDDWGIQTAYDALRSLPLKSQNMAASNCVGVIELNLKPRPETFGEMTDELRRQINEGIRNQKWLNHMKWALDNKPEERPRLGVSIQQSNIGQVYIKHPIKDVMMRVSQEDPENLMNMLTYSVISENKNIVKTHIVYGKEEIEKKEVEMVNDSLKFAIDNIGKEDKIDDALQQLIDFRKSKNYKF